jgi:hypothetical protein
MASIIYNSALYKALTGTIDFDTDTFYVMLVNTTYAAIADETKKDDHEFRSSVTSNEIANGNGYTTNGASATVGATQDDANNRIDISLGAASWPTSTITAYGGVYYKFRGGASSADELVAFIDFGGAVTSTNGTFSLTASTLRLTN